MKQRTAALLLLAALLLTFPAVAAGSAGTAGDPVISLSYLNEVYVPQLESAWQTVAENALDPIAAESWQTLADTVARANLLRAQSGEDRMLRGMVRYKSGDVLTLRTGTKLTLLSGAAESCGPGLADVTNGRAIAAGESLPENACAMAAGDCKVEITSATACFLGQGAAALSASAAVDYNSRADGLYRLGLFRGTDYGYELERSATRTEALVMFLRLLGQESTALSWTGSHPFTDVPAWADRYVSYAYAMGYTNGISATQFGGTQAVSARDYLTFLLRALAYAEGTDFAWASAVEDSAHLGLITAGEQRLLDTGSFLRAQVAYCSWNALFSPTADGAWLLNTLLERGAVARDDVVPAAVCIVGPRA